MGCLTLIIAPEPITPSGKVTLPLNRLPIVVIDPGHGGNDDVFVLVRR